jgi:hypothetical protein
MPKKSYSKGAKKALSAMKKKYGAKRGTSIFYAKANKYGRGKSNAKKANSVYAKGSHRVKRATKRRKRR